MRFIQDSAILFLLILLPVDAFYSEAEQFLHNDLEIAATESCSKMAASRNAFLKDVANDTKAKAYMEDLADYYKTQDRFARELAKFRLPFIIDDKYFQREYNVATSALILEDDEKLREYIETLVKMDVIFNTAKICPYHNKNCELTTEGLSISEIEDVMAESRDYDELLYMWKEWKDATAGMKEMFITVRQLESHLPVANISHLLERENSSELHSNAFELWNEVTPLYLELHTYVSRKLKQHYDKKLDISDGALSAHVLGNMWAKSWYQIEPLVRPFPNVSDGDLEYNMKQDLKVEDIFRVGDEFFKSMGLLSMKETYKAPESMLTKPTDDRAVVCYPNSGDFCNGTYRVTLCGKVGLENFIDIFRLLGNVQYFMQYKELPFYMRNSPSSAFHESIGESLALSATSPQHLKKLELLTDYRHTYESSINFLMKMALIKVAFLRFGFLVGQWERDVTNVPKNEWDLAWWDIRRNAELKAPIGKQADYDYDPIAFYIVTANGDAMAYFYSHFMEFQIYKALCLKSEEYNPTLSKICPLHNCDFYSSEEAGKLLGDALRLGALKPWPDVLEMLTGSRKVLSGPLLEYFQPLYEFLKDENEKAQSLGWSPNPILVSISCGSVILFLLVILYYNFERFRRRMRVVVDYARPMLNFYDL